MSPQHCDRKTFSLAGAGTLGQSPVPPGQSYEIPLRVNGQVSSKMRQILKI
jgi:hypothetical protein